MLKNILLIDDNPDDCESLIRGFKAAGYDNPINWFANSTDAITALKKSSDLPGLIILDLNMPGLNGKAVLKEIKEDQRLKTIPVIIFSTSLDEKDIEYSYINGANSYIQKPAKAEKMGDVCKVIGDYWHATCVLL